MVTERADIFLYIVEFSLQLPLAVAFKLWETFEIFLLRHIILFLNLHDAENCLPLDDLEFGNNLCRQMSLRIYVWMSYVGLIL